jgi:hypothetical protein
MHQAFSAGIDYSSRNLALVVQPGPKGHIMQILNCTPCDILHVRVPVIPKLCPVNNLHVTLTRLG